jgi:hypothetical protein
VPKQASCPWSKHQKYEMVINQNAAKAIGLTLIARADEVIE